MNTTKRDWQRVSRRRPCPVCGKPDWCLYAGPADSPTAAICQRVESDKRAGEAGWLHKLRDDPSQPTRRRVRTVRPATPEAPPRDFGRLAADCRDAMGTGLLGRLAADLGLSADSLQRLGVGWSWSSKAWTFPMADAAGRIVGIRLRLPSGRKLAVKGSREGLFIPEGIEPGGRLLVCEGPTDCAALLDLGFPAVGRPSCSGGVKHLCELVKRLQPQEVVIVGDGDAPGQRGAENLASVLVAYVSGGVRVITPPAPHKDARAWLRAGGTPADVQAAIEAAPVRRLRVTTKKGRERDARTKQAR